MRSLDRDVDAVDGAAFGKVGLLARIESIHVARVLPALQPPALVHQRDARGNIGGDTECGPKRAGLVAELQSVAVMQTAARRVGLIEKHIPASKLSQNFWLVAET